MLATTPRTLRTAALIADHYGLHTGPQFAAFGTGRLSVAAAIYRAATNETPPSFLISEDAALAVIRANPQAMDAIRCLSASLDTAPPVDLAGTPDHIEHIERWAAETAIGDTRPPTEPEVIGRILRAAYLTDTAQTVPHQRIAA